MANLRSAISNLQSPLTRRLLNASALIAFFFAVDKAVAFLRQRIVGQYFGLNSVLDAYNVANNLPDLLFTLISGSALSIALIPVLTETLSRDGRAKAWELFSLVANLAFAATAAFSIFIFIFAEALVANVVVPGFTPEQQGLVVELMRINLLATLIFSVSGLVMGALQANQHFLLPALAPTLYNVGQIVGVTVLAPRWGIYGLAAGVILGAVLHLAIQIPGLVRYGFRWTPRLTLTHPAVRHVLTLMGPRIITIFLLLLTLSIARDRLASYLNVSGAVSALDYGWLLMQFPETILGTALATAMLPTLSELVARGEHAQLRRLLRRALGVLVSLTMLVAVIAFALLPWAVRLVFEGRAFTPDATEKVALAAQMFMLGLVGHSVKEVTARTFYAYQDARTPLFTAAINLVVFVSAGVTLTPVMGFAALALANSVSFTLEAVVMAAILWRRGWL
ncbi:MAG: murein biosynthesis integral membrane protein MurJ [Anaerolineales bacterium]